METDIEIIIFFFRSTNNEFRPPDSRPKLIIIIFAL